MLRHLSWMLALLGCLFTAPLWAQEYVDAPPVLANDPAAQGINISRVAVDPNFVKDAYHQVSSGMVNYGYSRHPYAQFTGESAFDKGAAPSSFFANLNYLRITPIEVLNYVGGWAWGLEWANFASTSEDVLAGQGSVAASSVEMSANLFTVNARVFFRSVTEDRIQPFLGMGIGALNGDFSSVDTSGNRSRTSFLGLAHFNTFGTNVMFTPRGGMVLELRNVTIPDATTSNDPFNQGNGSSTSLEFTGTMLNFTGFYRF
ncbi:MAG: hypothetical protein RRB13_06635 [bacterium]|nr:hypothetical protein [bacterium]